MQKTNNNLGALLSKADKKTITKYIQFSKRVVAGISIAATLMCLSAMGLLYHQGDTQHVVGVINAYCSFAKVGFVSYSLNSIGEKWIKSNQQQLNEEQEEQDNG